MSPPNQLVHSTKRQRPADGIQDLSKIESQSRSKRIKTRQEGRIQGKSNENSSKSLTIPAKSDSAWSLDIISRGQIYDIEPVFSLNENYIFLSLGNAIQVYSVSARRSIRILQIEDGASVTGIKPAPLDPQQIYVSTSSGKLVQLNWESNSQVTKWADFGGTICYEIDTVNVQNEERTACFSLKKKKDGRWVIAVHELWLPQSSSSTEKVVLESTKPLDRLKVLQGGRVIVACASQHIIIGTLDRESNDKSFFGNYIWKEIRIPVGEITSLDARESTTPESQRSSDKSTSIDIAIGEASGAILIYQDILSPGNRGGTSIDASKGGLPLLQRLHWHREAVASLCWSRDGNYIISGGKECVLVFWQLDSARKNFLPHFSSSIHSIVVSPGGAFYAVQLAEKSITIISATELEPLVTINGLQLPSVGHSKDWKKQYPYQRSDTSIPTIVHPNRSERLSIAVGGGGSKNLSFLQTLNIRTGSYISRQALTRTNITTLNKGPEGSLINTPSVKFMDMSEDGKWLATVDRWSPSQKDLKAFGSSLSSGQARLNHHSEIFLKFWLWNDTQEIWELVTRVESPHFSEESPAEVLCLLARPGRHEIATVGADKILKVWQPTARHNKSLKNQLRSSALEHTWKCRTLVDLTGYEGLKSDQTLSNPAMSFSDDGSVLALSTRNAIHLIDTYQWAVFCSRSVSPSDAVLAVKFLKQSLIIQSKRSLSVWNVVDNCLKTVVSPDMTPNSPKAFTSLAVSPVTETFAVTCFGESGNSARRSGNRSTHGIAVYHAPTLTVLFETGLEELPISLLSDKSTGDYIIIDISANLRRVSCHSGRSQTVETSTKGHEHQLVGLSDIFGRTSHTTEKPHHTFSLVSVPDVKLKALDGIFDRAPSFALPPASALFKDVVNSLVTTS